LWYRKTEDALKGDMSSKGEFAEPRKVNVESWLQGWRFDLG